MENSPISLHLHCHKSQFFRHLLHLLYLQLVVRTLPTVIIFLDGVAIDKILGFEGLADSMPAGQEDSWPTIVLARLLAEKGGINSKVIVDDDEIEANMQVRHLVFAIYI